ncbi:MAG: type II secretion system protein [Phycisphaerae bacterium]|nr:type II secretion system protein [Phycisphaerae bacterium]
MNVSYRKNPKGFTLIELLVVIAIIATLLAILYPALSRARLQAKIVVVNKELEQIGLALNIYEICNNSWPLVRPDCGSSSDIYSLPSELIKGGYLPGHKKGLLLYNDIEDKFYAGHSYRYLTVGPTLNAYGKLTRENMTLRMPSYIPAETGAIMKDYSDRKQSPIKWVIFSLGPGYDTQKIGTPTWSGFPIDSGFPVSQDFWYSKKAKAGILTRIKTKNDQFVGTFQKNY